MRRTRHTGGITLWAWLLSLGLHFILLIILALFEFSKSSSCDAYPTTPNASITQIEEIIRAEPTVPKPKLKNSVSIVRPIAEKRTRWDLLLHPNAKSVPSAQPATEEIPAAAGIFQPAGGGLAYPEIEFFGQRTDHRKICFVVDCSGSMHGRLGQVQKKLKESIAQLKPDHYFYIIFFRGDKLFESGAGSLQRATDKNKAAAIEFVDRVRLSGKGDALKALRRAMQVKDYAKRPPTLVYFLTDGFDLHDKNTSSFPKTIENLRKALAPGTTINTIAFWARLNDCKILKKVAENSGGSFLSIE